jgi:hypothetical protein
LTVLPDKEEFKKILEEREWNEWRRISW